MTLLVPLNSQANRQFLPARPEGFIGSEGTAKDPFTSFPPNKACKQKSCTAQIFFFRTSNERLQKLKRWWKYKGSTEKLWNNTKSSIAFKDKMNKWILMPPSVHTMHKAAQQRREGTSLISDCCHSNCHRATEQVSRASYLTKDKKTSSDRTSSAEQSFAWGPSVKKPSAFFFAFIFRMFE